MQSKKTEFDEAGIAILAVSADAPEDLRENLLPKGITFPLLSDPELTAIDAYGLRHEGGNPFGGDIARPALFFIDAKGQIVEHLLTDNWRVRPTPGFILEKALTIGDLLRTALLPLRDRSVFRHLFLTEEMVGEEGCHGLLNSRAKSLAVATLLHGQENSRDSGFLQRFLECDGLRIRNQHISRSVNDQRRLVVGRNPVQRCGTLCLFRMILQRATHEQTLGRVGGIMVDATRVIPHRQKIRRTKEIDDAGYLGRFRDVVADRSLEFLDAV